MRIVTTILLFAILTTSVGAQPLFEAKPTPLNAQQRAQEYALAVQNFSDALFFSNDVRDENMMISPLSALLALGMTANGAAGQTQQEMLSVLAGPKLSLQDFNAANQAFLKTVKSDKTDVLRIANSLWANELIELQKPFMKTTKEQYFAQATNLDFSNPESVEIINNWVSEATRAAIPTIIDSVEPSTLLYLINAITFKDDWLTAFEKNHTRERIFHTKDGEIEARFLHQEASFDVLLLEDASVLMLPYKNPDYLMVAVLPKPGLAIDSFLSDRKHDSLTRFLLQSIETAEKQYIELALPAFESSYKTSLVENLKRMGMQYCFDASLSDFSNMQGSIGKQVVIDDVLQKTYIKVDEQGTEAAAVTAVIMKVTSIMTPPSISLIFDRPFFYAIIDQKEQIPLFMGVLDHPKLAEF